MTDIELNSVQSPITMEKSEAAQQHNKAIFTDTEHEEPYEYSVFSKALRTYLTYFLGFTMILSTLTATIYFPLIPILSTQLRVSIQAINLTVTVYAITQALSPAFFASLADSFGRRPVELCLVTIYAVPSLGLALNSTSYPALLALRALQSIGGSSITSISYGIVADVAPPAERGSMLGPMLSTCNGISAVGPVIGGAVALSTGGVKWVFFALFVVAALCVVLVGFTLPETARTIVGNGSVPAVGIWRTWWSVLRKKRPQREDGHDESHPSNEKRPWRVTNTFAAFRIILYRDAVAVLWMVASSYSVYYTFQVAIPVISDKIYEYNDLEIGLVLLPGLAGMTIGGIIAGKLVDRNYAITARNHNVDPQEKNARLQIDFPIEAARYRNCFVFILFEVLLVIGYGWAVYFRVHPAVPIILQFFICGTSTLLSHTASTLLVDIFPEMSSTAYASGQIMRCGLSAASAAVIQPLINAVGYGWYFSMFSLFIGTTGAGSVFISRLKGMKWRQKRVSQRGT
ncbi:hypothetical protein A0O28_0067050 [Trichoderma guizhouense]|uniref:Major facilitator superfamily (MFS) profile domain-containing protein n=1 Tax=Trichoderma guizhouense TaxID=1491466 RepID=A0A1T3CZU3_9HYPO|nr:hypothetical protein A0O28_0067050 [Trichoderma guizhouense]